MEIHEILRYPTRPCSDFFPPVVVLMQKLVVAKMLFEQICGHKKTSLNRFQKIDPSWPTYCILRYKKLFSRNPINEHCRANYDNRPKMGDLW